MTSAPRIRPIHTRLMGHFVGLCLAGSAAAAPVCEAQSGVRAPTVIELYTSQGCSSCPPAEQWISKLSKTDPQVVALAFHVSYWDSLGWPDPFATPENTQRQHSQRRLNGAENSYTPQIVIDGKDRPNWRYQPLRDTASEQAKAPVSIQISKVGTDYQAHVAWIDSTPPVRLEALWAVTQSHRTAVAAGENRGRTLTQDGVVREWRSVPAWSAQQPVKLSYMPQSLPVASNKQTLHLVILDSRTGRPLQAVSLGC